MLCGPAGSGKSTVLRMLAGLVPVTDGRVLIDADEVGSRPGWSSLVSMVFQNYALYPNLTVDQNIALPLTQRGDTKAEIAAEVAEVADVLDLTGVLGQNATGLSAGQRIRVAMARGMVRRPAVLLMDEPLANLELGVRADLTEFIVTAHKRSRHHEPLRHLRPQRGPRGGRPRGTPRGGHTPSVRHSRPAGRF